MRHNDPGNILAMSAGRRLALAGILLVLLWGGMIWAL